MSKWEIKFVIEDPFPWRVMDGEKIMARLPSEVRAKYTLETFSGLGEK